MLLKLFQNWSGGVIVIPIWHFFVRTYVCRALNHLISRDPQMLEPRFWCQNISIYGALMLLKFFQNWSVGFGVIPIFHFFEIL